MSLQIWLPLLTDIHNQGLYNIDGVIPSSNSSSFATSGKLGIGSMSGTLAWHLSEDMLNNAWSVATWIKSDGSFISGNNIIFCKNISNAASSVQIYFSIIDGTQLNIGINGTSSSLTSNYSFSEDNWYHVAATYNGNIATLYVNGEKLISKSVSGTKPSNALNIRINGRSTNTGNTSVSNYNTNFQFNDFRLYDHALSTKEVEEISKGLVLHYKLDNYWLAENLLVNTHFDSRYSQTTGWDTSKNGTLLANSWGGYNSGVANQATVYHAHLKEVNGEYVYEYIKDANNSWLGISQDGLQSKLTAGTKYTFSWEQYCVSGSNYVNTGLYYYKTGASSAKFHLGYAYGNSGRVIGKWQKFTYTFTAPSDADYAKRMAWYVYGAQGGNGTFYARHFKLEKGDKATPWNPAKTDTLYAALGYNGTTIYDSSGYSNNGTIIGNLTAAAGSPRYEVATVFNGTDSAIKVTNNNWCSQGMEALTVNLWAKASSWSAKKLFSCTETGGFNTEGGSSGYLRFPVRVYTNAEKTSTAYKYDNKEIKISDLSTTDWVMITFVYDTTGTKTYINGELHHTYSNTSYGIHFNMNARLFLGCEAKIANPSTPYLDGQESDFRIYATALSAAAIKELYDTSASIDASGNIYARELVES